MASLRGSYCWITISNRGIPSRPDRTAVTTHAVLEPCTTSNNNVVCRPRCDWHLTAQRMERKTSAIRAGTVADVGLVLVQVKYWMPCQFSWLASPENPTSIGWARLGLLCHAAARTTQKSRPVQEDDFLQDLTSSMMVEARLLQMDHNLIS